MFTWGQAFHDLDDFLFIAGRKFTQEILQQKFQERIEKTETNIESNVDHKVRIVILWKYKNDVEPKKIFVTNKIYWKAGMKQRVMTATFLPMQVRFFRTTVIGHFSESHPVQRQKSAGRDYRVRDCRQQCATCAVGTKRRHSSEGTLWKIHSCLESCGRAARFRLWLRCVFFPAGVHQFDVISKLSVFLPELTVALTSDSSPYFGAIFQSGRPSSVSCGKKTTLYSPAGIPCFAPG